MYLPIDDGSRDLQPMVTVSDDELESCIEGRLIFAGTGKTYTALPILKASGKERLMTARSMHPTRREL